ncbi:MAG: polymer-forming cytoskeletal protein [Actinobacteria bacterium]|nr:polymer-forming cytoskeletal protein [Actinomycetota bacterium]
MSLRKAAALVIIPLILAGFSAVPLAADFRTGERHNITGTVDDDIYAAGEEINVSGDVTGDVMAAARSISVDGSTGGSLFAAGETVDIGGEVGNSARVGAREVTVSGSVTGDLLAGAQFLVVEEGGSVGRDLIAGVQEVEIAGEVGGDVSGGNQTLEISGTVRGDVRVEVENLTVADGAVIEGDVVYTSNNPADIDPGAQIDGDVQRRRATRADDPGSAAADLILPFLRGVGGSLVLGLLVMWLAPGLLPVLARKVRTEPLLSIATGIGAMIVIPFVVVFLFVTAMILGAGVSVPLLLVAGTGFLLALAKVVVGFRLGAWMVNRQDPNLDLSFGKGVLALTLGVVILTALFMVPILGGFVRFFVGLLALGAGIVALAHRKKEARPASNSETEPAPAAGA